MNTWPSIYREGALALSPDDVAKGNREMDALIKSAAQSIAKREALLVGSYYFLSAVLTIACVIYPLLAYRKPPLVLESNLALVAGFLSVATLALTWRGWAGIQHWRSAKRLGDLSGVTIPPPLQELIDSFASGVREVRNARGDKVLPGLFASRWAIMLFSHDHRQRSWVRGPNGEKYAPQIYAEPDQPESVPFVETPLSPNVHTRPQDEEPPCDNHASRDQWLVGGALRDFERGRDAFIAERIPAHNAEWFRTVLTVGRREMRKGRQVGAQKHAITIIQQELGNKPGLRGGESQHHIKQLLQGRYGATDIRGYFVSPKA